MFSHLARSCSLLPAVISRRFTVIDDAVALENSYEFNVP